MLITLLGNLGMFGQPTPPPVDEDVLFGRSPEVLRGGGYGGLKALEEEEERLKLEQEEQQLIHHLASTFIIWRN